MLGFSTGFVVALLLLQIHSIPTAVAVLFQWRSRTGSGLCDRKVTEETELRLTGDIQPSFHKFPPYCTVKILSAPNTKIKLTFENPESYECSQRSFVSVLDGWLITDGMRRSQVFIPETREKREKRERLICVVGNFPSPRIVESSNNLAEIAYKLVSGQEISVAVEFIPKNQSCDVFLDESDAGKEFIMDSNGKSGVCRWYLPGGAMVSITELSLVANEPSEGHRCNSEGSNRLLIKSGDSYSNLEEERSICSVEDITGPIPTYCKRTVLELYTGDNQRQYVKFSFGFTPYKLRALTVCSS